MARPPIPALVCAAALAVGSFARAAGPGPALELDAAIARRDEAGVQRILEGGGALDLNARNRDGDTPLHVALKALDAVYWHPPSPEIFRIIQRLLERGADPRLPFRYGEEPRYTALHLAAHDGNMVLVPLLVGAGADINARDSRGMTPLHAAARCDFRLSCDDCSAQARDDFASRWKQGARPVIRYLLDHGADSSLRTHAGQRALDLVPALPPGQANWPSGTCRKTYELLRSMRQPAPPPPQRGTGPPADRGRGIRVGP